MKGGTCKGGLDGTAAIGVDGGRAAAHPGTCHRASTAEAPRCLQTLIGNVSPGLCGASGAWDKTFQRLI